MQKNQLNRKEMSGLRYMYGIICMQAMLTSAVFTHRDYSTDCRRFHVP